MEIIRIPLYTSNVPVPAEGQRDPNEPPVKYGLENILNACAFAKIPDPNNIVVTEGTALAAIGATASLAMTVIANTYPITWMNTRSNKLKFRVKTTFQCPYAQTLDNLLATYNCIVLNTNIAATPYGGFLVLTIGKEGSGADLILSEANLRGSKFYATINRVSEEF